MRVRQRCQVCGGPAVARQMCERHYSRFKNHGSPTAGRIDSGVALQWLFDHAKHVGADECLIWPYAKNDHGYGQVKYDGKSMGAHRAICIIVHGKPPSPKHQAAHSCAKGHLGCVNPNHLRWATAKENADDMHDHREAGISPREHRNVKLSDADIIAIRSLPRDDLSDHQQQSAPAYCANQRSSLASRLTCMWAVQRRGCVCRLPPSTR